MVYIIINSLICMKKPRATTCVVAAVLILFVGIVGFNFFRDYAMKKFFKTFKFPAAVVSTVKAKTIIWRPSIKSVGNFVALEGVDINSEATGNVTAINFKSGEFVKKGQALIVIDDSVEQATLKNNEARLTLNKINYKRQQDLFKKGATSDSNLDSARAAMQESVANLEKTQAQINQKHIKAPFSGKAGIRLVSLGQYITPGQTNIVTLQSLDPLRLQFYIPEQQFKEISLGQKIKFTIESFKNYKFVSEITAINSKIDTDTHNILIEALIANCPQKIFNDHKFNSKYPDLAKISKVPHSEKQLIECNSKNNAATDIEKFIFLPGMFAKVAVDLPVQENVTILPATAITYSLYGDSVFLVEQDSNKELIAKRVFVITGDVQGNYTAITKGVKPGQEIVSTGGLKLDNNSRIKIDNSTKLKDIKNPDDLGQ